MLCVRCLFFAAVLVCVLGAGMARAAVGDYILKGEQVYRVDGGEERLCPDLEPEWVATDAGEWAWVKVHPLCTYHPELMQGTESGVYFFRGKQGTPAGFAPVTSNIIHAPNFSPSGEMVLVSYYENVRAQQDNLELYLIDGKGFTRQASFPSLMAQPEYWVDRQRFAFTMLDKSKSQRREMKGGAMKPWWPHSAVLYDAARGRLTILRESTEARDYTDVEYDSESHTLLIQDDEVHVTRIPVPAAD